MANLKKIFSPQAILKSLVSEWRRFPMPVIYLTAFSLWNIISTTVHGSIDNQFDSALMNALSEGFLLALAANIWCGMSGWNAHVAKVQTAIALLITLDFVYLLLRGGGTTEAETLGRSACYTAIVTAILFLPGFGGYSRSQLYDYTRRILGAAVGAAFISAALAVFTWIIFGSLHILFHINNSDVSHYALIVLSLWIPGMIFMYHIPRGKDIIAAGEHRKPAEATFCKTIMLPAVIIYAAILIIYGIKILIEWNLPNASITWMVTGLMCVMLITLYGLQYYTFGGTESTAAKLAGIARQWLPVILLPLLALMTVGLIYRINQYGITVSRLYTAAFDAWAFGVVLYMLARKNANLNLTAMSFAVVFVLVSIIPGFNLTTLSDRWIRNEIISTLTSQGIGEYPITMAQLEDVVSRMPKDEGENLISRLEYLDDYSDHSRVSDIVSSGTRIELWRLRNVLTDDLEEDSLFVHISATATFDIPEGYHRVTQVYKNYPNGQLEHISGRRYILRTQCFETEINLDSLRHIPRGELLKITMGCPDTSVVVFSELTIERHGGPDLDPIISGLCYFYFTK